jgi:hypothetical protein
MKTEFDNWFWEMEGYHIRSERFWDDFDNNRRSEIYKWLQTAFEMGYNAGQRLYGGTE